MLKMPCQPLELRYFHTGNIGSVGQRASKLLAIKVVILKKKSGSSAIPAELRARV